MRHTAAAIGLTAALLLAPAAPAFAQAVAPTGHVSVVAAPAASQNNDNDDDSSSGGWGLWGLLGLLGLAGLMPRKKKGPDVPPRTTQGGPTTGSHPTDPRI